MIEKIGAVVIILFVVAILISTQLPPRWQTLEGVTIVALLGIPALLIVATILAVPMIMVPAAFLIGLYASQRS